MRRRPKALALAVVVGLSAALFAVWAAPWVAVTVAGSDGPLTATGDTASPSLSAFALAGLALAAALAIAGPRIRLVLGVLLALLGGCAALGGVLVLADPVGSVTAVVTAATGVAGEDSVRELVRAAVPTAAPVLAVVLGGAQVLAGVAVVVTGRRWPDPGSRYAAGRTADAREDDPVSAWDDLSRGDDPTGRTP